MLQQHYGISVTELNLVVLCPDYDDYHVVEVPVMDDLMQQITSICRTRQLGFRLLQYNK